MRGLEVVLIGNEQLEGESMLIRFPDKKWMIIDSCVSNIYPGKPLPQLYLEMRGYNKVADVSHIVCTHWHLDHIEGLPSLLEHYTDATFVYSYMNDEYVRYFYDLLKLQLNVIGRNIPGETAQIYDRCMNLVAQNHINTNQVKAGSIIKQCKTYQLVALSPSDKDNESFLRDIQRGVIKTDSNKPNKTSLSFVLQNTLSHQELLFGGDLQINLAPSKTKDKVKQFRYYESKCNHSCGKRKKTGWCGASKIGLVHPQRVKYVKLAHHGSPNGYCSNLMSNKNAIGTISCFASSHLPNPQLLREYCSIFKRLYITNQYAKENEIHRNSILERLSQISTDIQIVNDIGVIATTISIAGFCQTCCYGNAYQFVYSQRRRNFEAKILRMRHRFKNH